MIFEPFIETVDVQWPPEITKEATLLLSLKSSVQREEAGPKLSKVYGTAAA